MKMALLRGRLLMMALTLLVASCGGSDQGSLQQPGQESLTVADVQQVIAQAVAEATARHAAATIGVVDRVGNVLAVYKMTNAQGFTIDGGRGVTGGLEGVTILPPELAVISKAVTAAYFSSAGNAFSTRTAGQIIQEHFNPGEPNAPAGPLFGVQFSQLTCSDVSRQETDGTQGPHRAPLGFAADPGGMPLYKNGTVVGAIGVLSDGKYSVVTDYLTPAGPDQDELIAVAGTSGFAAPTAIRADHITVGGLVLSFDSSEALASNPANAPAFNTLDASVGQVVAVPGYNDAGTIMAGTTYGMAESGIVPDTNPDFAGTGDYILVDAAGNNRYPPMAGTDGLMTQAEVTQILKSALTVANDTRAQVRQPSGSTAQVSVVVVDTSGTIVGYIRSPDALVDSVDVVAQKARTALFFSSPGSAAQLQALSPASLVDTTDGIDYVSPIASYVTTAQTFFNNPDIFNDGAIAFSTTALTGISSPLFPDGLGPQFGPLSKPYNQWSIFTNGLELDLVLNKLAASLVADDRTPGCTGIPTIANGITLFGGGFPIYRGNQLVGGIGVSGDGTQQSDLIAFVGLAQAAAALNTGIGNAPAAMRADTQSPQGVRLKWANCPVSPYLNSDTQDACDGL